MNNRQFVIVVVITFIVIVIWIIADIIHTQPSVEINPKLTTLLTPINPNFDQKVVAQIKEISPVTELEPEINSNNRVSTSPTPTPASSSALIPNQTPIPLPIPVNASSSAVPGENQ